MCYPAEENRSANSAVTSYTTAAIDATTTTCWIAAYAFSHPDLTAALTRAHARKVDVRLLVTPTQQNPIYSTAPELARAGIQVRTDRKHKLFHNKYAILDHNQTLTGSANFTRNADEQNAENAVIIDDPETNRAFRADFTHHWEHADPYRVIPPKPRKPTPTPPDLQIPNRRPRKKGTPLWHASPVP